jgi:hypothetical protein
MNELDTFFKKKNIMAAALSTNPYLYPSVANLATEEENPTPLSKWQTLLAVEKFHAQCHLGGEIPADTLMKYASPEQQTVLKEAMKKITNWVKELEDGEDPHPLLFGTDDATLFNATLTKEFFKLCQDRDLEKIVELAKRSFAWGKSHFGLK